jgi:hypothetical protein
MKTRSNMILYRENNLADYITGEYKNLPGQKSPLFFSSLAIARVAG